MRKMYLLVTAPGIGQEEPHYRLFMSKEEAERVRERFSSFDSHRMTIHETEVEFVTRTDDELYRRIHVDQGRRATNKVNSADHDIIRIDNERGDPLAWGGTIVMVCGCGCDREVARFVQPLPDRAYVVVSPGARLTAIGGERKEG